MYIYMCKYKYVHIFLQECLQKKVAWEGGSEGGSVGGSVGVPGGSGGFRAIFAIHKLHV